MAVFHFATVSVPVVVADLGPVLQSPSTATENDRVVAEIVIKAGGLMAICPPVSGIESFREAYPNGFDGEGNFPDECYIVGPRIVVASYLTEELDDRELLSMIYHEDAHLLHRDLEKLELVPGSFNYLDDIECELAADAHAVRMTGGNNNLVASSLVKVVRATGKIVGKYGKMTEDQYVSAILSDDGIKQRLKALA